ncbi:hypothetical protein EVAR_43661_1 [Eumeta japonica]|uniref:Uncharacterized protein n=1 Tax=Eumeta variegata TaxID=151549 RepID=A0A4C1XV02_EUMVA|nr:hypothetical protein EVAR_43661_1 [Eumeta japonica]
MIFENRVGGYNERVELSKEVLHTLLLEVEHIVNSRPLTEVGIEPTKAEGLTPNHFLIRHFCGAAVAGYFDDNVLLGPANWRTCQRFANHFWQRWLKKYLLTLVSHRTRGDSTGRIGRGQRRADRLPIIVSLLVASRQN